MEGINLSLYPNVLFTVQHAPRNLCGLHIGDEVWGHEVNLCGLHTGDEVWGPEVKEASVWKAL